MLFPVDPEEHGLLRVVALHLHHNVILAGLLFGQVLLAGSATDLALFVEEVEHTPQDGQQQDADDEDRNDNTTALFF